MVECPADVKVAAASTFLVSVVHDDAEVFEASGVAVLAHLSTIFQDVDSC